MAKKSMGQKRVEREREENRILNRVFCVFLAGLVLECYLLVVYRGYVNASFDSMLAWYDVLGGSVWAGLALLVVGGGGAFIKRVDKKVCRIMAAIGGLGLFLAVSGWVMTRIYPAGVTAMCALVPVVMLLCIVFLLFQHECFLSTMVLAGGLFTAWLCSASINSSLRTAVIVGVIVVELSLVGVAALTRRLQTSGGKWKRIRIYSADCDYRVVYAVLGATFLCILIALAAPVTASCLMWVLGILLFAELAYYTTKLM